MNVIGTAGHVDHGKSALVERLTGIDPDRFEEEKRRGLTIDLGFAWLQLPSGREVGLIDVPGHERFIKNMLAGAGGISVCLFVVAATEGWKPQSAEHLAIVDILGIEHGVVALTKSDLVDDAALALVEADVAEHISHSSLAGAPIVACSAVSGAGIEDLVSALDGALSAAAPAPERERPRLWVDRVFTIAGAGTVVTGTLAGGTFHVGEEVELARSGRRARIRAIQSHKKKVEEIGPGNRVALNLVGLDRHGAERGDAVIRAKQWRSTDRIDATIRVSPRELSGTDHELTEKGAHLIYVGSAETPVRVKLLQVDRLRSGESGFAELYLRDSLPLARGDRFVLRDAGRVLTFGGGVILDPIPNRARRNDPVRLETLERLGGVDEEGALRVLLESEGSIEAGEAILRSGAGDIPADVARFGDLLMSQGRAAEMTARLRSLLQEHHVAHPLERAAPREEVRTAMGIDAEAFDDLVAAAEGLIAEGTTLRLSEHEVAYDPEQQAGRDRLMMTLNDARFSPPFIKELDAPADLVHALVTGGDLIRVDDFYLTKELAAEARAKVRAAIEERGPLTVAEIRDLLETTRKYAVPLCEWLDATGATRRQGDTRALGPTP